MNPLQKSSSGNPPSIVKEAPQLTNGRILGIAISGQADKTYGDSKTEQDLTVFAIEQVPEVRSESTASII